MITSEFGQPIGLVEVVRRQQHGQPVVAGQRVDLGPQLAARLRVEAGRRLVEEQHGRPVHEAQRDVELALHPARPRAGQPVGGLAQPEPLKELVGPSGAPRGRCSPWTRPWSTRFSRPVAIGSKPGFCETYPIARRTAAGSLGHVRARRRGHDRCPARDERGEDLDGGGLAGAVRTEQPEHGGRPSTANETPSSARVARSPLP